MEIDTTPPSPIRMTLAAVLLDGEEREVARGPQLTTPLNPTSNITSSSQTHFITLVYPDAQAVDEAFVMANYSQLEPLIEDVDEEREMKASHGFQPQPLKGTEGRTMQDHLRGGYENDADSFSLLTRWIEEFQFLDGLKVPPHVGYYDWKQDPDNFIHVFEGAMRMEKWAMPVTCYMFVYILKDVARVWWNSLPKRVVTSYEDLNKRFRTHFKQQKKHTKTHLAINGIKRKEGESVRAFITHYTDETAQITRLNEDQRIATGLK
ncbi:reverse transcriptase domain-containing protein [Tanacetum coccineum]